MAKAGPRWVREQLKKKLVEVLPESPRIEAKTSSVVCLIVTRLSSGLQAIALYTKSYRRESCRFRDFCWERERSEVYIARRSNAFSEPKHDISVSAPMVTLLLCVDRRRRPAKMPNQPIVLCILIVCLTLLIFTGHYTKPALRVGG